MRSRGPGGITASELGQILGIVALTVLTLMLCVLAFRHTNAAPPMEPSVVGSAFDGSEPDQGPDELTPSSSASSRPESPPHVRDQRRADFTAGDPLPDGSRIFDSSTISGMALRNGVLTHGGPAGAAAASYLETRLSTMVAKLGARVVFPAGSSGSLALIAWPASVVDAGRAGAALPEPGLRLVVTSGGWKLVSGEQRQVVGDGEFDVSPGRPVRIEVVRDGSAVWVTDPARTTRIEDPAAARLAGPWASWALLETSPDQAPAAIEAVWAG